MFAVQLYVCTTTPPAVLPFATRTRTLQACKQIDRQKPANMSNPKHKLKLLYVHTYEHIPSGQQERSMAG